MRVDVLGPLRVLRNDGTEAAVTGARLRGLVTLLALSAGRPVSAERIAGTLWTGEPPRANTVQSLVSRLRSTLGNREAIAARPDGYVLRADVDALRFEALVGGGRGPRTDPPLSSSDGMRGSRDPLVDPRGGTRDGTAVAERLREALGLWRGEPDVVAAVDEAAATRLRLLRDNARVDLAETEIALGDAATALPALRELAAEQPHRQRVHALLLRALSAIGEGAEALAHYETVRRRLAEDLGADPDAVLRAAHAAVLRGTDPARSAAPHPAAHSGVDPRPARAAAGPVDADAALQSTRNAPTRPRSEVADADAVPRSTPSGPADPGSRSTVSGSGVDAAPLGPVPERWAALPVALTSFVGRDADLAALREALDAGRLVTVTGAGGAGKTRTALRLAGDLSSDMDACLVELAPVSTEPEVVSTFLAALGMGEGLPRGRVVMAPALSPTDQVLATLRDKRILLVVDNCEHLLDAVAGLVARVLARCQGVVVLATSREPLGVAGEAVYPLGALPYPEADSTVDAARRSDAHAGGTAPETTRRAETAKDAAPWQRDQPSAAVSSHTAADVDAALAHPAVRLLAERGAAARRDFAVTADNLDAVIEICRRLDGLPLAIELAAARLRGIAPADLAERLGERFRLLTGGDRGALPRHRTLRAVVDWSWELLGDKERALLARLSVFAGGAVLDSIESVCGADVARSLASLVDKSLVVLGEDGRYRLLETIREYGAERLAEHGDAAATHRAHAACFLRLAETAEPRLRTAEQVDWLRRLDAENDNLMAAIRWAVKDGDADTAQGIVGSACLFWWLRGRRAEGGAAASLALAAPGKASPLHAAKARLAYALHAFDIDPDLEAVTGTLREAREIRDAHGLAEHHPMLRLLDVIQALIAQRDAVMLRDVMGNLRDPDPWLRATAHAMHAAIWVNHGRVARAENYLRTALGLFEEVGERWGQCMAHAELSEIVAWSGALDEAKYHFETALRIEHELGVHQGRSEVRGRLSYYRFLVDDPAATRRNLESDLEAARRVGAADNEAFAHLMLAFHHERVGEAAAARRHLRECMELAERYTGPPHMQAMVATVEARLTLRDNDIDVADDRFGEAIHYAVITLDGPIIAQALEAAADIALARRESGAAATLLGQAELARGVRDDSSPSVAATEDAARKALGDKEFEELYRRGRRGSRRRLLLSYGAPLGVRRPPEGP